MKYTPINHDGHAILATLDAPRPRYKLPLPFRIQFWMGGLVTLTRFQLIIVWSMIAVLIATNLYAAFRFEQAQHIIQQYEALTSR